MHNILCFSRNRCTAVERVNDDILKSRCRLQDTTMDACVEITVRMPELEITDVTGSVHRSIWGGASDASDALKNVIGTRVAPGLLKIIRGLIGDQPELQELSFMVEECCHGVILSLTRDVLRSAPKDEAEALAYYADMVKENIRLLNRCAAFAPGSSLVEGIEPPSK